jgi:uncharacterized phage infection (PIP) family protein YhgE
METEKQITADLSEAELTQAYEQALELGAPAESVEPEQTRAEEPPEPAVATVASPLVEESFQQVEQLQQPAADPAARTAEPNAEGSLSEVGELVQGVASGELEQPEGTGVGQTSDLDPAVAELQEKRDYNRFGLVDTETGTEALPPEDEPVEVEAVQAAEPSLPEH